MDTASRVRLKELTEDPTTRVVSDGGSELNGLLRARIAELEAALRRAIHVADVASSWAMWPDRDIDDQGEEWASIHLKMARQALGVS